MIRKSLSYVLYALLTAGTLALYIYTTLDRKVMKSFFSYGGYYLMLLLFVLWVITIVRALKKEKPDLKAVLKELAPGIAACLVLTALIFITIPVGYRVLSDETNLAGISKSLFYEKRADNVTMGKWYYDNYYPINRETPKRPLLFPFAASLVHTVSGYRPGNLFFLNFLILFLVLSSVFILIRRSMGDIWAYSAIFLVSSQPLVVQTATSAGFELCATLFFILSVLSLRWFMVAPSPTRFQLLWMNLLMFTNIRYEGILYSGIFLLFLALLGYIRSVLFKKSLPLVYFATPLILLSTYWQRMLMPARKQFEIKGDTLPFSLEHFVSNNKIFFKSITDFRFFLPYNNIVNLMAIPAAFYTLSLMLRGRILRTKTDRHLFLIVFTSIALYWSMCTSFHEGIPSLPSSSRYFMFSGLVFCLLLLFGMFNLSFLKRKPAYVLSFSLLMLVLYHPVSVQDRFFRTQTLPRRYRSVLAFMKDRAEKNRNFLIISNRPGQYAVQDLGSINFSRANRGSNRIRKGLENNLHEDIYVVQDIEYKTNSPSSNTSLDDEYKLETLWELQKSSKHFTRVSKVTAIDRK